MRSSIARVWVEDQSRIEMHLVSKRDQVVDIAGTPCASNAASTCAPSIATSTRYESFANLAASAHLVATRIWTDAEKKFSVQLLEPRKLQ